MRLLRYHEAAEEELINEIGYLELQAHGLGRRFFNEVRYAETRIAQFPEAAQEVRPGVRKHMLRTFRYSLIYTIEPDGVLILAVAHQHRRPGYWAGRLTG
jgi:plasmid stabilization system protein ParE